MSKLEKLFERKKRLSMERDLCAEFYNLMLSKANESVDSPQHYDYYLDIVELMEPYARETKEEIRELNKQICELVGVEDIKETDYHLECEDRYGFSKPEL
jgi:hypothetical protein